MSVPAAALAPSRSDAVGVAAPAPWRFATTAFEAAKLSAILGALPRLRYRRGLEVGCSIGVLTEQLARRCEGLLAVDMVELALDQARRRCRHHAGVAIERMQLPDELPDGRFDLIVLSEVAYCWSAGDIARVAAFADRALEPGGDIVLVHWIGESDYPLGDDGVAQRLLAATRGFCRVVLHARRERYRIDVLQHAGDRAADKHSGRSVAGCRQDTGGERRVLRFQERAHLMQ